MIPQALFELAEKERIVVRWWKFVPPIRALYYDKPGIPPLIGLDRSLVRHTRLLRCFLAEELGHHFVSVDKLVTQCHLTYSERLRINKEEYRAMKWAALHLISDTDLADAFRSGCLEIWELAERFDVTEEMMRFRLGLLDLRKRA